MYVLYVCRGTCLSIEQDRNRARDCLSVPKSRWSDLQLGQTANDHAENCDAEKGGTFSGSTPWGYTGIVEGGVSEFNLHGQCGLNALYELESGSIVFWSLRVVQNRSPNVSVPIWFTSKLLWLLRCVLAPLSWCFGLALGDSCMCVHSLDQVHTRTWMVLTEFSWKRRQRQYCCFIVLDAMT